MSKASIEKASGAIRRLTTIGLWASVSIAASLVASFVWAGDQVYSVRGGGQFLIGAPGGAKHGTKLKIVSPSDCTNHNPDCNWTLFPNGMIVSDADPSLAWNAYGGATDGADITLVNNCRPNNTDCTWTIRGDGLIVSNTNLNLAVWANNTGIRLGDPLKLSSRCLVMVQGDCGWQSRATFRWPVRGLSEDDYFDIITNVPGIGEFVVEPEGASDHPTVHKTELETSSRCLGCKTWSIRPDGLITIRGYVLAWNAYGGAHVGTKVTLVDNCPSNNTDCQWDFTPEGFIVSRTNPKLAVRANMRPHVYDRAPLVLVDNCTTTLIGCTWRRVGSPR